VKYPVRLLLSLCNYAATPRQLQSRHAARTRTLCRMATYRIWKRLRSWEPDQSSTSVLPELMLHYDALRLLCDSSHDTDDIIVSTVARTTDLRVESVAASDDTHTPSCSCLYRCCRHRGGTSSADPRAVKSADAWCWGHLMARRDGAATGWVNAHSMAQQSNVQLRGKFPRPALDARYDAVLHQLRSVTHACCWYRAPAAPIVVPDRVET
jgi:hypothetical protein